FVADGMRELAEDGYSGVSMASHDPETFGSEDAQDTNERLFVADGVFFSELNETLSCSPLPPDLRLNMLYKDTSIRNMFRKRRQNETSYYQDRLNLVQQTVMEECFNELKEHVMPDHILNPEKCQRVYKEPCRLLGVSQIRGK
ncbi:hypothetical protein Tco_0687806, partial [Tanacetum coccineum]